ncbi:aspartate/glutamate racemase family protein [Thalassococcus sp. CAU 1522]|uniref:Aspartate/glutamate racemase family protein n=1 Tax=Thalassococcus arenae TaxID=2851652 RepID=A0ABS6N6Z1_9RHOB|nr:aspartate/glutamate racemase family protein [Thalassococcus arenae]MBV2359772.1 aspartate/glutamate racemase family protein [Thalassococcus arenae]
MTGFPYTLDDPDTAATLGLIVLQADQTIEADFRRLFPNNGLTLHVTRIPSGDDLTSDSIARMESDLPHAAGLFPRAAAFDAVGYACTSGTTLIGAERVAALVSGACRTRHVCDPLTAAIAACRHLGAQRIGLVSPYSADIAMPVRRAFETAGIVVANAVSFGETQEARVVRISAGSIRAAAEAVARSGVDAVFLSCTNLRTLDVIPDIEATLGLPVFGSNLALARAMGRHVPHGRPAGNFRLLSV